MPKRPFRLQNNNLNSNNDDDHDENNVDSVARTTTPTSPTSSSSSSSSFMRTPSIRFMMIVLVSLLVFVAVLLVQGESKFLTTTGTTRSNNINLSPSIATTVLKKQQRQRRERRLGDDCLLVYLDVGSNIGVHNRFLMEPLLYPEAKSVITGVFDKAFGSHTIRDNRDICAFGFEPNPIHKQRQQALQNAYQEMGWRYTYIGAGVSDRNGNITFYHKTGNDKLKEEWGFSMVQESPEEIPEIVPIIHLTEWIRYHITERTLPKTIYGNYIETTQQQGKVVMKLDIEGEEFHVLPNLLMSGIFCSSLDVVFGEYHPDTAHLFNRFAPSSASENIHDRDRQGELQIGDGQDAMRWFNGMIRVLTSVNPQDCRGRWINLDDEHYLHDGIPFPEPPPPS